MDTILIVPGLSDSCERHWQSWLESHLPNCVRVMQRDWESTYLPSWSGAVRAAAERAGGPAWIVAHSFGCLAVAHAAAHLEGHIAGALLVAPADPAKFGASFALPRTALPFRTVLVGSANDPWMSLDRAQSWARMWGAAFVNAGAAGHINALSGHGPWPDGIRLLRSLQSAARQSANPTIERHA